MGGVDLDAHGPFALGELLLLLGAQDVNLKLGEGVAGPGLYGGGLVGAYELDVHSAVDVDFGPDDELVELLPRQGVEHDDAQRVRGGRPMQADDEDLLDVGADLERHVLTGLPELPYHAALVPVYPPQRRGALLLVQREHVLPRVFRHLHDLQVLDVAGEVHPPHVPAVDRIPGVYGAPESAGDPALALAGAQVAAAARDVAREELPPHDGAAARVDGAEHADVAEGVEEGGLIF